MLTGLYPGGSIRAHKMTKVLIIGSGGREHAIVWALQHTATSPVEIFCAPGNAGIGQIAHVTDLPIDDHAALVAFVESEKIDLTFVGPEAPLAAGIEIGRAHV